ncbi:hypothetical protein FACS18949_03410 [Clostridia bacterium]|nr:hypothetical protein FACS18949_03410 [Clostridia bacterium]
MQIFSVNRSLYVRDTLRAFPAWVLNLLVMLLFTVPRIIPWRDGFDVVDFGNMRFDMVGETVYYMFADFLTVMIVFGYMFNARATNFFFSIPVRRESLFLTKTLACLTAALVPMLVGWLTMFARVAVLGGLSEAHAVEVLFGSLFMMTACHISLIGLGVLLAAIIGNGVAFAAIAAALQVVVLAVWQIVSEFFRAFLYGYTGGLMPDWMSLVPSYAFIGMRIDAIQPLFSSYLATPPNYGLVAGHLLAGLAMMVLGCVFYRRRDAERSGDIVAFRFLQPIFKYCAAVCAALAISTFLRAIYSGLLGAACGLLLGGFIGFWGAEMLIRKTFRVWKRGWVGYAAFNVLLVLGVMSIAFDWSGYEARVPKAGDVKSVYFQSTTYDILMYDFTEPDDIARIIALHEAFADTRDRLLSRLEASDNIVLAGHTVRSGNVFMGNLATQSEYVDSQDYQRFIFTHYPVYSVSFRYTLNDGRVLERYYNLLGYGLSQTDVDRMSAAYTAITRSQIYARHMAGLDEEIQVAYFKDTATNKMRQFTRAEAYRLREAVLKDMADGNIGRDQFCPPNPEPPETLTTDIIWFNSYYPTDEGLDYVSRNALNVDTRAAHTRAMLRELGVELGA